MTLVRCLLLVAASCSLSACGGGPEACDQPKVYQEAREGSELVVPDGLDELQPDREYAIPEVPEAPPNARGAACLERPPGTYSTGG